MSMTGDETDVDIEDQDLPDLIQTEVYVAQRTGPIKKLDHQLHFDGCQSDSDTLELRMERGVLTITIPTFKKEIGPSKTESRGSRRTCHTRRTTRVSTLKQM